MSTWEMRTYISMPIRNDMLEDLKRQQSHSPMLWVRFCEWWCLDLYSADRRSEVRGQEMRFLGILGIYTSGVGEGGGLFWSPRRHRAVTTLTGVSVGLDCHLSKPSIFCISVSMFFILSYLLRNESLLKVYRNEAELISSAHFSPLEQQQKKSLTWNQACLDETRKRQKRKQLQTF